MDKLFGKVRDALPLSTSSESSAVRPGTERQTDESDALKMKLQTLEAIVTSLEEELNQEKKTHSAFRDKVETWKEKVKMVDGDQKEKISALEQELDVYKHLGDDGSPSGINAAVTAALEEQREIMRLTIEQCQKKLSDAEVEKQSAQNDVLALRKELEQVRALHLHSQQTWSEELQSLTAHAEEQETSHVAQLTTLRQQLHSASTSSEEAWRDKVAELRREIQELEQHSQMQCATLKQQLIDSDSALQEHLRKLDAWKASVKQIKLQDEARIEELHQTIALQERELQRTSAASAEEPLLSPRHNDNTSTNALGTIVHPTESDSATHTPADSGVMLNNSGATSTTDIDGIAIASAELESRNQEIILLRKQLSTSVREATEAHAA
ncbi:Hypothetical protein, putative, partial [Bodo saltans]